MLWLRFHFVFNAWSMSIQTCIFQWFFWYYEHIMVRFSAWKPVPFLQMCLWASYRIRKIAGCACAENAGNVFPRRRLQTKLLVSDPGMHHDTSVTHVPWCMSESLTRGGGENVPGIPGACAPAILRIWHEVHTIPKHPCDPPAYGPPR